MATTTRFHRPRREFLKLSVGTGGGLVLGFVFDTKATESIAGQNWRLNAWLQINTNGNVTIMLAESEMGQGVLTSMPMLVAEELEVDWRRVKVRQALVDPVYGWQGTGGSRSVRDGWRPLREAGAAAREMLIAAAARTWEVSPAQCRARDSIVHHGASGRRASYGELVTAAAEIPIPKQVRLKNTSDFRIIGRSIPRLDTPAKVNGSALFGMDVRIPNQLTASVTHCPVFGGKPGKIRSEQALRIKGVRRVVPLATGVAVVADDFWSAHQGLQALDIEWEFAPPQTANSSALRNRLREAASESGTRVRASGDIAAALKAAHRLIEADYETPFQAHATMEPMCCTADVRSDGCTIWAPTQQPTGAQREAAKLLLNGREPNSEDLQRITVHTTLLGGGFGRRNLHDFVHEAVQLSRTAQKPVQLIWSREEDMQHDYYHPATFHRLKAGMDRNGMPVAWEHRIVGSPYASGAEDIPYAVPSQHIETVKVNTGIPTGPWRSVAHAYNAFAVECFVDELAAAARRDALEYRLALLGNAPRHRAVLELAASKSGWGRALPEGHYRGLAVHASFGSYVAQVVEISVNDAGLVRVHRVTCAVDCGIVVNPNTVVAQMEGSIVFGLTAALKGQITIRDGRVEQSNFHDYPILRMDEMPRVDTYLVPSKAEPGGVGEPGVPPLAPAVANAVYAASGKRIRRLPLSPSDLK